MLDAASSTDRPDNALFFPEDRPWVEHGDHVRLLASRCRSCGQTAFPPKAFCHACGSEDLERFELSEEGVLYTYSEVHAAPRIFKTPYLVGYVDFPEGVRVFGQIDAPHGSVAIGGKLRAHLAVIRSDDAGTPVTSFKFGSTDQ